MFYSRNLADKPNRTMHQKAHILVPTLIMMFIIGCSQSGIIRQEAISSGISGRVLIGPTCLALGPGMEEECKDRPYQAPITIKSSDGLRDLAKVFSDFKK
jgi:hypothetical protein